MLLVNVAISAFAQDLSLYKKEWYINGVDTLPYRILLPDNYDEKKKYPVIYFLHGAGERGRDNEKQLVHGARLFLRDSIRKNYQAIVVFPQCSENSYWSNVGIKYDTLTKKRSFEFSAITKPTIAMQLLLHLTNNIEQQFKIDKKRIYVMGLSMGGMGTFEIANRKPQYFAAAMPICGGGDAATATNLVATKWWVFHGVKDDVVLPYYSDIMVGALQKAGATVQYTLYPTANHNSWDLAFAEPELLKWLFAQTLQ